MRRGDISSRRAAWMAGDTDSKGHLIRKWSGVLVVVAVIGGSLYILSIAGKLKRMLHKQCEDEKAATWSYVVAAHGNDSKQGEYLLLVNGSDSLRFFDKNGTGVLPIAQPGDSIYKVPGTFDISWKRPTADEPMLLLAGRTECD